MFKSLGLGDVLDHILFLYLLKTFGQHTVNLMLHVCTFVILPFFVYLSYLLTHFSLHSHLSTSLLDKGYESNLHLAVS